MGPLGTGKRHRSAAWRGSICAVPNHDLNLGALVPKELHTGAPMNSSTPVSPEERPIANGEWMQENTHLTRLFGGTPIPLTRLSQGTGAATAKAGSIHHTQAAIGFSARRVRGQLLGSLAPECPIRLERKVLTRKAPRFPGQAHLGSRIACKRSRGWGCRRDGRSKFGNADGSRLHPMSQFKPQVPYPLADQLPGFLSRGRVAAPAIGIDLLILIREYRRNVATMQIQFDHIGSGECLLREVCQEQFVDHTPTRDPNRALLFGGGTGRHDHATQHALGSNRHLGAVVETAHESFFRDAVGPDREAGA